MYDIFNPHQGVEHTEDVAFGGEDEGDSEDDDEGDDWDAREGIEREEDDSEEGGLSEGAKIVAAISNSISLFLVSLSSSRYRSGCHNIYSSRPSCRPDV